MRYLAAFLAIVFIALGGMSEFVASPNAAGAS